MTPPSGAARIYHAIGGAAGCFALSKAFYANVERDPILRPFFASTFKCAIEEFAAFLVQFLGGESEASQPRWWLSLRESHSRFALGSRERTAWLRAMAATLDDASLIPDPQVRSELLGFFRHSSAHIVNTEKVLAPESISGELGPLWNEQLALDEFVEVIRPGNGERGLQLLQSSGLQARFKRSSATHASVLSIAATSNIPVLREYARDEIRANPSLVHERYKRRRTLLHDAAAAGDLSLVELLLDLGAGETADREGDRSPLYCVGNECSAPDGGRIVHVLLQRSAVHVNTMHGVNRCTALHMAARRGNVDVIEALLNCGADIEARDSTEDTPLRRAVNCSKVDAARLLLGRGANPHSIGSKGLTPVRAARNVQMKALFS